VPQALKVPQELLDYKELPEQVPQVPQGLKVV
jgi:hypothetical protein